jgi:glycosyltransferase involved in cell wall biosynthesis
MRLTVAICTKDRPEELRRCLASIGRPAGVELMIVDDGRLNSEELQVDRYIRKERPGLYESRREAVARAQGDVVLFLDDDVEVEPGYVQGLMKAYEARPQAAGVGGVDLLLRRGLFWRLFSRLFYVNSGDPGKLSATGYNGSQVYWPGLKEPFESQFLSGCNMSFKREALLGLPEAAWLEGYSLGEDLVLSHAARKHGPLFVDPALQVRHHSCAVARDKRDRLAEMTVVNQYHILRMIRGDEWSPAAFRWMILGFQLRDLFRPRVLRAFQRGLRKVRAMRN